MERDEMLGDWLREAASDPIVVSDDSRVEARQNWRTCALTTEQAAALSIEALTRALEELVQSKNREVRQRRLAPMLIYVWFDEVSGSLSLSLVTDRGQPLDFRCPVNASASLADVVGSALASRYLDGIPFRELEEVESTISEAPRTAGALPVYVARLV